MKAKKEVFARLNSRARLDQIKYIKDLAVKLGKTEGEINRSIIDFYISKHK